MGSKIKNDVLKSIVVVLSIIIFVVGVVFTAFNTGDTYADGVLKKYVCEESGYPNIVVDGVKETDPHYCCPNSYSIDQDVTTFCKEATETKACYYCNGKYNWLLGAYTSQCTTAYGYTTEETCLANNTVTVTYNANGGKFLDAFLDGYEFCESDTSCVDVAHPAYGKPYIVWYYDERELARDGFTFEGWYDQDGKNWPSGEMEWDSTENVTLYARWSENVTQEKTYTVYFYNGSTKVAEKSCTKSDSEEHCTVYVPSAPSKEGHTFIGWSKDCNNSSNSKFLSGFYVNDNNANVKYYACFEENKTSDSASTSVNVIANANGGRISAVSGVDNLDSNLPKYTQTCFVNSSKTTCSVAGEVTATLSGKIFKGWGTSASCTSGKSITEYSVSETTEFYACYVEEDNNVTYKINYTLNGGSVTGNPTSAKLDEEIIIKHPTKNVTVVGNDNKAGATIGKNVSVEQKFVGWTSSNIDTKNAYYGDKLWSNGSTMVTDTKFKNLSITNGASVTLVANWEKTSVTLPTVKKDGYTCKWNTKEDGKGSSYNSGGKYTISANSETSINLYAICEVNTKADEEIDVNNKTGDALIYTVWVVGVGALGYSVYYFIKKKNNL